MGTQAQQSDAGAETDAKEGLRADTVRSALPGFSDPLSRHHLKEEAPLLSAKELR